MNHKEALELLAAYAIGACDPPEVEELKVHLAGCAECQLELASFTPLINRLDELTDEQAMPPGLVERTVALVQPALGTGPNLTRNRWLAWSLGLAACLLLATVGALAMAWHSEAQRATQLASALNKVHRSSSLSKVFIGQPTVMLLHPAVSTGQPGALMINYQTKTLMLVVPLQPGTYWLWLRHDQRWDSVMPIHVGTSPNSPIVIHVSNSAWIDGAYLCPWGPDGFQHPILIWASQ